MLPFTAIPSFRAPVSEVLVIGHRNPDTDSICSAIGYAEFKRRTGLVGAVAARCGDLNDRTEFVLRTFDVPPPRLVADVTPRVRDVMASEVWSVSPQDTVAHALTVMDERNIRVLPVLRDDRVCQGLLSVFKMMQFFLPPQHRADESRRVLASIRNLANTLGAQVICEVNPDREEELLLMIGAMSPGSFAERLTKYPPQKLVVIVGDRMEVQDFALRAGVRALIITGNHEVSPAMLDYAQKQRVTLLVSPHDTITTAQLCRTAMQVARLVHEQFLTLREDEPIAYAQQRAAATGFQAFPVVGHDGQVVGILSKSDFGKRVARPLILVDHNELGQAVHGAEHADIIEIIDHHRIGSISTRTPIYFRNEPVGSTSTIVAECFFEHDLELPRAIAGLLLAGLVSDTLNLTSPTATARDGKVLKRLEGLAGVNAAQFTEKLFAMGSVLTNRPAAQAVLADCKEYAEDGHRFSVAQIEEIGFEPFWKRKDEVLAALATHRREHGYEFAALLITDVVQETSLLVVEGSPELHERIDFPQLERGSFEAADVVSRKKQLLPYLSHRLALLPKIVTLR